MEIRPAAAEEHDVIGAMTVAAYAALPGMGELGAYGEELADIGGRHPTSTVLVAAEGAELLGNVTYYPHYADELPGLADRLGAMAGFRMLATVPAAQGRGVGEALTRACIERARLEGAPALVLHTTELMQAAQRLYRRVGFERWPDIDLQFGRRQVIHVLGFRFDLG